MQVYRQQLNELAKDDKRSQLAFPPLLDSSQRKQLHNIAHNLGLKSKSHGKGKISPELHSRDDYIETVYINFR